MPPRSGSSFFGLLLLAVLPLLLSAQSRAETLYDNGMPGHVPRANGFEMTAWVEADDFILTTAGRVESVRFWSIQDSARGMFNGIIAWQIYANTSNDRPGQLLYSGMSLVTAHEATGYSDPYVEYVNTFDIPATNLPAGVYWLALHNGPYSNYVNQFVYWETTQVFGARPSYNDPGPAFANAWFSNSTLGTASDLAFQVSGVTLPRVTAISRDGAPRITFTTTAGYNYRLEYKNELSDVSWATVTGAGAIAGTGSTVEVVDQDPQAPMLLRRFYRAVVL